MKLSRSFLLAAYFSAAAFSGSGATMPAYSAQSNGPSEAVVAADGSGTYRTVQEAIAAAPTGTAEHPSVIRIKAGTYHELLYLQHEKRYLRLIGEDPARTIITYGLYAALPGPDGKPIGTFRTSTATFDADDVTVENLTLANDAGNKGHTAGQAVAVRLDGDRIVFRNCRLTGWQDTLLDNRGRHLYSHCEITGAVDFIFGAGTGFFDHCRIVCAGTGYITAASTPRSQPYGLVFSHCSIAGSDPAARTYLGRPWRDYAHTVFLQTEMSDVVRPEGWSNWSMTERDKTARYSEFENRGPGAGRAQRVPWSKQLTPEDAANYSALNILRGSDGWKP